MSDLTIYRGDTTLINLAVSYGGLAYDISDCEIYFTAKYAVVDADSAAVFQKTTSDGIVITSAINGRAQVTISPVDTEALPNSKISLLYDSQLITPDGAVYTIAYGNLIVIPDITLTRT